MSIDERARHELFSRLEAALGAEAADTLMAHLPPVGWADVATNRDLDQLAVRLDQRFEQLDLRFEATEHRILGILRGEMAAQTRTVVLAMIGVMLTFASVVIGAVKL